MEADPEVVKAVAPLRTLKNSTELPAAQGNIAPDFHLKLLEHSSQPTHVKPDGDGRVRLSDYRGKKPVVLIFGSYT